MFRSVPVPVEPLIKVSNQLVAAPAYSDVVIQCYVEASPKAMNTWWRESGKRIRQQPTPPRREDLEMSFPECRERISQIPG